MQIMIIDYKLIYPSGTATAVLINGFHTPKGDSAVKYKTFSHPNCCISVSCFNMGLYNWNNLYHDKFMNGLTFREQVRGFLKFFSFSFLWAFFQWFFAGGEMCGFVQFPTFGLKAWKQT